MTSAPISPRVDLVISVHDATRPLQRAIDSLLDSGLEVGRELRITVVCHNLAVSEVERMLTGQTLSRVRLLEFADGRPSPAGPYMHGIRAATGEYVAIMGSDDTLEPGALAAWWELADAEKLTALIPAERHATGSLIATPPIRPFRRGLLHPVRDRLVYRTAPLGLIHRLAIDELGLDMSPELNSGSDQLFGLKLWFSAGRIAYGAGLPHYVVGADAATRVTTLIRPIGDELRAATSVFANDWVRGLPLRARRLIATKYFRVHVIDSVYSRVKEAAWTAHDATTLRVLLETLEQVGPGFERSLSLADRRVLDALRLPATSSERLHTLVKQRSNYLDPRVWLTRGLLGAVAVDGPLRFLVAGRLLRRGRALGGK